MIKSQDFAAGAINAKFGLNSLKSMIHYINEKCENFVPNTNYVTIDAKLNVIGRLAKGKEDCDDEEAAYKAKYSADILEIMDKMGVGDCVIRTYLETQKAK